VSRLGPSVDGSLTTLGVVAAGVIVLSIFALQSNAGTSAPNAFGGYTDTRGTTTQTVIGKDGKPTTVTKGGNGTTTTVGGNGGTVPTKADPKVLAGCNSSNNGGSTDRGVSATSIKLGATVVTSGIGATLLGPVSTAMRAVADQVNESGGICGRHLDLKLKDDAWKRELGYEYIRNLVEGDKVFALAVNPSSEGLTLASENKYLAKTKTPVVGSDGMLISQYTDPWIWPVAASTVSTAHIMAYDACSRLGAKNFGIVFDSKYKFGREGAFAFNAAVKRCTGHDIDGYNPSLSGCTGRFCAIEAGKPSYDNDNHTFDTACFPQLGGNVCDYVAFLLEPNEAVNFLRPGLSQHPKAGLAQTLFTRDFARRCGSICDSWNVWTGYNPPIEEFAGLPAVKDYVATVHRKDGDIDVTNQFLEGGYAGMQLLVEALKRVGPNLTRDRLVAALNSMDLNLGLTTPLRWRADSHYANVAMQAFSINYKGGFNGFSNTTSWVKDPYVGQDQG
jgi:ABC-type branched-subunit amino acid transport system substrate-binding protein